MELRHIRYMLAIAEERHFTRAAERLGIAQPPLSQQIRALEDEIGAPLFHRHARGADLTEAGAAFVAAAGDLPALAARAIEAARRAAKGETGQLHLGLTGTAALNPKVSGLIRSFKSAWPELRLELTEANSALLAAALVEERLDIAVLRPSGNEPDTLVLTPLAREALVLACPDTPARIRRLGDLAAMPLILTPREVGYTLHDAAIAACREAGFEPLPGPGAPQIASILTLVAAGLGFAIVPEPMRQLRLPGVRFLRPADLRGVVRLALAHRQSRPPRAALNLVGLAGSLARDLAPTGGI